MLRPYTDQPVIHWLCKIICVLFCVSSLPAQQQGTLRLPTTLYNQGGYDTVGYKLSTSNAVEASGLIDKEINPNEYVLGPNDVLGINIVKLQPLQFDAIVTADGKVILPSIGAVYVGNKSLRDAQELIKLKVEKVYKAAETEVVLRKVKQFKVTVTGAVRKPTIVSASSVDRVSEVIDRAGGLLSSASERKITILRNNNESLPVDIRRYFGMQENDVNPKVRGGDIIVVPTLHKGESVTVQGSVGVPGDYEFVPGDKLSTILHMSSWVAPFTEKDSVEINRFDERGSSTERIFVNISQWKSNSINNENDILLRAGDKIYVRSRGDILAKREISIAGSVKYPGRYTINKGEVRLSDIIIRAGGFLTDASLSNSIFLRRTGTVFYDRELDRLSKLPVVDMSESERRYYRTKSLENVGYLSIDYTKVFSGEELHNPVLVEEDSIYIPQKNDFITLIGKVVKPGQIPYQRNTTVSQYIQRAGGWGYRADQNEIIIKRKTGENRKVNDTYSELEPGDEVLVPETDEVKLIDVLTKSLTILAQIATVVGVILALRRQ